MPTKSIQNTEVADLTNCASEPIHIPGSIQPNGCLIAIDKRSNVIEFVSANVNEFIHIAYETLLGKPLDIFYREENWAEFSLWLNEEKDKQISPFISSISDELLITTAYNNENLWIIEYEREPHLSEDDNNSLEQNKRWLKHLQHISSSKDLCQSMAEEIKFSIGFDRVMVYRFDQHYNGEIFAESKADYLEPFLGLHYPHTDIPAQARQLYLTNLIRVISDVNYTPVPIYTHNHTDRDHRSLDLSLSNLRSVSPVHVEYLHHMGVSATLTISLVVEGKLWGLVACHHYSKKYLTVAQRTLARLLAYLLTAQIPIQEKAENLQYAVRADSLVNEQVEKLYSKSQFIADFSSNTTLAMITEADAVILHIDGKCYQINANIPTDAVQDFISKKLQIAEGQGFDTDHISTFRQEHSQDWSSYPGVLFRRLSEFQDDAIIWLRKEQRAHITWAGDPAQVIQKINVEEEVRLSPRKSFEKWVQEVQGLSKPWNESDRKSASTLAFNIRKLFFLEEVQRNENEYKLLNQKLKDANDELSILNWVSTHDLKEPLRKIQLFATRILAANDLQRTENIGSLHRILASCQRMSRLLDDINMYIKVGMEEKVEAIDLNLLLKEIVQVQKDELEVQPIIELGNLPTVKGVRFQIGQVFQNLIINAIKFCVKSPVIQITANDKMRDYNGELFYQIDIWDNGIGFDQNYSEKIFGIFQRLHNKETFEGSGIGLAICRKIMHLHNGKIFAESQVGKGSKFTLLFRA